MQADGRNAAMVERWSSGGPPPAAGGFHTALTCVAHLRRHRHRPRHRRSPNRAAVSRRAAYASPRASNRTSVTIVIVTNRLATRTTHVSTLACLAGAGAGRLTSSRVPRRRATPCRRRRRSTVAVHTAIVVATVLLTYLCT